MRHRNTPTFLHADFVVIGAGSAGAVVANRLSADTGRRVVVLEAGPNDSDKFVHIPAAFAKLFRSTRDWDYLTEPQKELDGRQIYWPRGKMLGGSSSMNAMMWVRGFAADYDEWGELAGDDWSSAQVIEYFRRIENATDAGHFVDRSESGVTGPMHVSRQRSPRRSTAAWLTAAQECGYPLAQPNSPRPDGFCETVVTQRKGTRWSTADAYLKPALKRKNLILLTEATATRVVFNGTRATGVEFVKNNQPQMVHAHCEVILCGGAINSPQLLMLSGIGDSGHLSDHGIDVVRHTPEVGRNLMDHLCTPLEFDVQADSLFAAEKPLELIKYLLRGRGMLTSNLGEAYGFVRSKPDLGLPDLELLFAPTPFPEQGLGVPHGHAVISGPILVRPRSRGTITLASADPLAKPVIDPRYLSDPDGADRAAMMSGLRMTATIAESPALKDLLGQIAQPAGAARLDDDTLAKALATTSQTLYHPVGTCRMGIDDASVVDPQLRVRGVDGLRVADASIMPSIIRGHTHAASVMVGERAADLIRSSSAQPAACTTEARCGDRNVAGPRRR